MLGHLTSFLTKLRFKHSVIAWPIPSKFLKLHHTAPRRQAARVINLPQEARAPFNPPDFEEDNEDPLFYHPRRRDPVYRGRHREDDRDNKDVKITFPTFEGKVDPDAYIDWERRMDYIFECYGYNERKKVAVAAAQLTNHALSWWDREMVERRRHHYGQVDNWQDMKFSLRRRYVPPHYHRDIQNWFRHLRQGSRSVEEYYEEFETLKNRLELDDTEESLMAQFVDGLQDRIARKVERHPYDHLFELLHLATQVEQQLKRKAPFYNRSWKQPSSTPLDKGKGWIRAKEHSPPLLNHLSLLHNQPLLLTSHGTFNASSAKVVVTWHMNVLINVL